MEQQKTGATGRRKESTARVVVVPGSGKYTINGKKLADYLTRETLVNYALHAFSATDTLGKYDIDARTLGGGLSGQAGAIRLAVARALDELHPEFHDILRQGGFLTRDSRKVERKKYGQPKARKRFQYSKR